jgi:hypothetical protein
MWVNRHPGGQIPVLRTQLITHVEVDHHENSTYIDKDHKVNWSEDIIDHITVERITKATN